MAILEYYKVLNKCWDNKIFVIQVPIKKGRKSPVELVLQMNGLTVKKGEKQYTQNTLELENKIMEIYYYIYNKQF